jgi:hypothetical protein
MNRALALTRLMNRALALTRLMNRGLTLTRLMNRALALTRLMNRALALTRLMNRALGRSGRGGGTIRTGVPKKPSGGLYKSLNDSSFAVRFEDWIDGGLGWPVFAGVLRRSTKRRCERCFDGGFQIVKSRLESVFTTPVDSAPGCILRRSRGGACWRLRSPRPWTRKAICCSTTP